MAVLTLHSITKNVPDWRCTDPDIECDKIYLGNFIDLSTEEVVLMQDNEYDKGVERLRKLLHRIGNSDGPPPADFSGGSILVTDAQSLDLTDNQRAKLKVCVCRFQNQSGSDDVTPKKSFNAERLLFDRMTYEDVRLPDTTTAVSVEELDDGSWETIDLTELLVLTGDTDAGQEELLSLVIGTRFILKFRDPGNGRQLRYFRFLVHALHTDEDQSVGQCTKVVLQFEELRPHRVIVPLGIEEGTNGFQIVTTKDIPPHFVNEDTRELMWSIRPSRPDYDGSDIYDRPFPVAKVVFRTREAIEWTPDVHWKEFTEHPPAWAGTARQRSITSRSYMNTTYSILVNHGERLQPHDLSAMLDDPYKLWQPGDDKFDESPGADNTRTVSATRYKYNLYLVDGSELEIRDYDPGTDVEDQM